jgi:hypothetical protein
MGNGSLLLALPPLLQVRFRVKVTVRVQVMVRVSIGLGNSEVGEYDYY